MGRKCFQIGMKEDRLGKKDNLQVEILFHCLKVDRLGRKKYVGNFCEDNIFEKLPRLFVQN